MHSEVWKPIPSLPGYEASSFGRIRSVDREVTQPNKWGGRTVRLKGTVLALAAGKSKSNQYLRFVPSIGGIQKTILVHHAVCEAFHGSRPPGMECLHRDDVKTNNVPDNLRWGTRAENMTEAKSNGAFVRSIAKRRSGVGWLMQRGSNSPTAKLTEDDIPIIRQKAESGIRHPVIAAEFGVSRELVSQIARRVIWRHVP